MDVEMRLAQLPSILDRIIAYAKSYGVDHVSADRTDYYWIIADAERYDFERVPEAAVGSLRDDIVELQKMLSDSSRVITSCDIDRLASVLTFLSHQISAS